MINGIRSETGYQNTGQYTKQTYQHMPEDKSKEKDTVDLAAYYTPSTQTVERQDSVILTLHSQKPHESKSQDRTMQKEAESLFQKFVQFMRNMMYQLTKPAEVIENEEIENEVTEQELAEHVASVVVPVQEEKMTQTWFVNVKERIRIQLHSIRNSLSKFLKQDQTLQMGTGSQENQQEKEKENQNKLTAFVSISSGVEVQPSVVSESHLLDSYDRRGHYSKLGKN
ncbi:MAG: hypothetical protein IJ485_02305 [Lachnospiraceae bacterium]|nr:hypothetical protein [Lachnospiraceae bacterium]